MKRILVNLFFFFALILVLVVLWFTFFVKEKGDIYIFGYKPFFIATGSMEPEYKTKSLVIIKKGGYEQVKVGDVIAFKMEDSGSSLAFHRVVNITKNGFTTKGDNNNNNDTRIINKNSYIGKEAYHTNFTASYLSNLKKQDGIIKMIVLPLIVLVILIIAIYLLCRWKISKKKKLLIISIVVLLLSITSLIFYNISNSRRIKNINNKLEKVVSDFSNADSNKSVKIDGNDVLGIINIPKINLEYPIIKYIGKTSLNQSITHFSGPSLNEIGNVSLAGHRANGNVFFTNIDKLVKDDIVTITDIKNKTIIYKVIDIFFVDPKDSKVLEIKEKNKRELTLISCGKNNKIRYIVKLVEK